MKFEWKKSLLVLLAVMVIMTGAVSAASTELTITKLANDGTTILQQRTVDYTWMESNLTVFGDDSTCWYLQGPVFTGDRWNPAEDDNLKNWGLNKGTNVKDLCDLVGGMEPGDTVKIWDGAFAKIFPYENVYSPDPRQGPMVVAWWWNGTYVPTWTDGMRLLFMADNSTNPYGYHCYGIWDMNQTLDPAFHHYFYDGGYPDPFFPSTTGLSVKYANELIIYSQQPPPEVIFGGDVMLTDGNFTWTDSDGTTHEVSNLTPHGALELAGDQGGFTYGGGWSGSRATALIDWIDSGVVNYTYNDTVTPKLTWNYQLNGVYQNYFSATTGVSNNVVADGDYLEFYYGPDQETTENATAVVRINVSVQGPADILFDGDLYLNPGTFDFVAYNSGESYMVDSLTPHGALDAASKIAGFGYNATDKKWLSMGTMLLDDVDEYRYDSNVTPKLCWAYRVNGEKKEDFSSAEGISVYRIYDGDLVEFYYGHDADSFENALAIVRTVVHIKEQDVIFDDDVTLLPGTFTFTAYNSGLEYELNTTTPHGALDTASKIGGFGYNATDKKWSTMGTMLLDDIGGYLYNNTAIPTQCWGYAVNGVVMNDYSSTEGISVYELQNNDRVEFFYGDQGDILQNATAVARIRVHITSTDNWTLTLRGALETVIDRQYFEEGVACLHYANYTDVSGTWEGMPLWDLVGYVDDEYSHGPGAFNDTLAAEGYQVKVIASDGYNVTFNSTDIARNNNYIIANSLNGQPLLEQHWPLKLVGSEIIPSQSVARITTIELVGIEPIVASPSIHIVKYGPDGVTIINETNVTVDWMESNLDVIGDGTTVYRFEGITNDPEDIWDQNETYPGGYKVSNAVKGTRVRDLCGLVGDMGSGTEIKFIARDGYETTLPYSSIYTDPAVQARQGDAILAWYADGDYVPQYTDGIRLFFTPEDLVYGQWDMHETLPDTYWHYYYQSYPPGDPYYPGVLFPSCAGLSAKFVETIEIYSTPVGGWNLVVDGTDIGGLNQTISKNYFEQALACQFGANHGVEYTDSQGRVWGGMPLWFLCGFVDDADMHSDHAYNETLASMGYNIVITADDGYSQVFDSRGTIRNNNYIIANTLNGTPFPEDDSNWPLRLVGVNVSGSQSVRGIASIILTSASPAVDFIGTPQYGTIPLTVQFQGLSGTSAADWWIWEFGDGLVSYDASPVHTYQNAGIYTVTLTAGNAAGSGTETKIDYIVAALPPNPGSGGNEGDGETYSEPTPEVTQAPAGEPTPTPVSTQPIITPTVTQTVTATKGTGETEVVPTTASPLIYAPLLLVGTLPFLKRKK